MSLFDRLFGSLKHVTSPDKGSGGLEHQLRHLEARAKDAPLGARGTLLNRAGDVCLRAGNRERALRYFGEAIDALLADEQPEPARGVAKKIVRIHPEAVRTLCTLAWLDLAARQFATAVRHLDEFVQAMVEGRQGDTAVDPIVDMATAVKDPEFLEAAAVALEALGAASDAERVRGWMGSGGSPKAPEDPEELAALCLERAARSNTRRRIEDAVA